MPPRWRPKVVFFCLYNRQLNYINGARMTRIRQFEIQNKKNWGRGITPSHKNFWAVLDLGPRLQVLIRHRLGAIFFPEKVD